MCRLIRLKLSNRIAQETGTKPSTTKHMNREINLKGKVAIIGGGSGGIGSKIAEELHSRGVTVVLAARNKDKLQQLCDKLGGERVSVMSIDLTEMGEVEYLFDETLKKYGRIDCSIASAGTWHLLNLDSDLEDAEKQSKEDYGPLVQSTFNMGVVAQKYFTRTDEGLIINISSHAAKKPQLLGNLYYGAAKAAGTHFMLSLAAELRAVKSGVRVCDIQPEIVNTPENAKLLNTDEKKAAAIQPEEIAVWIAENFSNADIVLEKPFKTRDGFVL